MSEGTWQPFRTPLHYLGLPRSVTPPIWRERRAGAELAALRAARPAPPTPPEPGAPVLVVPGFAAGDDRVALLRDWLREGGWDARPTGLTDGRRCSSRDLAVVEAALVRLHTETGRPVTLVGHSRGGMFAKALAVRRPRRVRALVTLGSPLTDPFGIHLAVRLLTMWMATMTRLGRRDWVRNCPFGDCCREVHDDVLERADRLQVEVANGVRRVRRPQVAGLGGAVPQPGEVLPERHAGERDLPVRQVTPQPEDDFRLQLVEAGGQRGEEQPATRRRVRGPARVAARARPTRRRSACPGRARRGRRRR